MANFFPNGKVKMGLTSSSDAGFWRGMVTIGGGATVEERLAGLSWAMAGMVSTRAGTA